MSRALRRAVVRFLALETEYDVRLLVALVLACGYVAAWAVLRI